MGRGRQKAKHTKIARELKSFSPSVNYSALERELGHADADENTYEDKWADQLPDEEEDGEGEEEAPQSSTSHVAR
jgi:predicted  nucleic acid-binding Zn-ribbon protein